MNILSSNTLRLLALAAGVLLILPGMVHAAEEDRSFRLGKLLVMPRAGLEVVYTSNLFLESDLEIDTPEESENPAHDFSPNSDTVTTLDAGLAAYLPARDFTFGAGGQLRRHWYKKYDSQDATDYRVFGSVEAGFAGGLGFKLRDTYEWGWLLDSFEFGEGENYDLNELNLDLWYDFHEDYRLRFQWVNYLFDYEISLDRDRREDIFTLTGYRRIAPKTAALLEIGYGDFRYDQNPTADNSAVQLSGGLSWEATARHTGILQAGYEWKDYDVEGEGRNNDGEFYTLSAGLKYLVGRRTDTALTATRRSVESNFQDNPYFVRSKLDGNLSFRFMRRFVLRGEAWFGKDDYPNETTLARTTKVREDDYAGLGAALDFEVGKWFTLNLSLEYEDRDSSFDVLDYKVTVVTLSLEAGVPVQWLRRRGR